ncbi:hypothetical protein Tco_1110903 [Tanacetum coccineum]|uniref:Uncharacterized protein n=1 Tax=Tanacetum coccineum TaxID=301880 RepID=A0ABQ5ILL3_9ASTR
MSNLKFTETHNLVGFLEKPEESNGFEGIIDFLNASSIRYVLTVNLTIYTSCNKQFWATAKAKTVNGEVQIQALVDGKKVIVTETSVRRALQLKDVEGEGSEIPTDPQHTPTIIQTLLNSPKETTKEGKQKKDTRLVSLAQVVSSEDEGLGAQEDASKQGRKIADLDADAEVTLVSEAYERNDDNLMFDIGVLDEHEFKVEKKDQILVDEEIAQRLQEELQAELEEEERLARQKEEEDNLISWDNTQAMMEVDYELAQRLQAEEQGELTIEERSKLFVELMDKRKKHFAKLRAEEIRRKPPTKAQKRN